MPNATHFVSKIQWGAIAIATVKYTKEESDTEKEIKAALEVFIVSYQILSWDRNEITNFLIHKN